MPASGPPRPPRAHTGLGHLRATGLFLVAMVFVVGFAYPLLVTGIAEVVDPGAANGSLLRHNGTVVGSSLIAQNLSAPYLFWARPSATDYNMTLGAPSPPGPTDPALQALLNETLHYMQLYGNLTVNATLPYWWVAPSASSLDPDLVPEAVLVQVPRVAAALNQSIPTIQAFVNKHIARPWLPFLGVEYVNVMTLDLDLLEQFGR